jgi:hypothetical protein
MNHRGIWMMAAVLAVVVLLAQIAGASTRDENVSGATSASVSAGLTGTAWTDSVAEQASSVAHENSANRIGKANESLADRETTMTETNETNETNDVAVSAAAHAPKDGTKSAGTRPGWGCGDQNHKHSGPPGRPGATPPPGCAKP